MASALDVALHVRPRGQFPNLAWVSSTDVPFYSLPHIPGLVDREGTVKESFEIPAEWNEKLIHQFSKSARWMDLEEARQSAESMEPSKSEEISG